MYESSVLILSPMLKFSFFHSLTTVSGKNNFETYTTFKLIPNEKNSLCWCVDHDVVGGCILEHIKLWHQLYFSWDPQSEEIF